MRTVDLVRQFTFPTFEREPSLLALRDADAYGLNGGRITSSDGLDVPPDAWERRVRGGAGPVRPRSTRAVATASPPARADGAPGAQRGPAPPASRPRRSSAVAAPSRSGGRCSGASSRARSSWSTRSPSRLELVDGYRRPSALEPAGRAPGRPRGPRRRRAAAVPSLRHRRADGLIGRAPSCRPRARTRHPSRTTCALFLPDRAAAPRRGRDRTARGADPLLRPLHLLRHALPGPARRGDRPMKHAASVRLLVCGDSDRADDGAALRAVRSFVARRRYRMGRMSWNAATSSTSSTCSTCLPDRQSS